MTKVLTVVAAALINPEDKILLAQRPEGKAMAGLWEFPGGKLEPNETPEAALVRELREELGLIVNEKDLYPLTFASHAYPNFHLLMPLFGLKKWDRKPTAREGQTLAWVDKEYLFDYPAPEADIPLFKALQTISMG